MLQMNGYRASGVELPDSRTASKNSSKGLGPGLPSARREMAGFSPALLVVLQVLFSVRFRLKTPQKKPQEWDSMGL